ncbi:MAG: hypothetical protein QXU40_02925, partial [Candidatus Pacearchaeota archaeon]
MSNSVWYLSFTNKKIVFKKYPVLKKNGRAKVLRGEGLRGLKKGKTNKKYFLFMFFVFFVLCFFLPVRAYTSVADIGIETAGNVSASWLKGIFNWIIGISSQKYLSFNGTELNFNETNLNSTIDARIAGGESDPLWTGNYSNVAFINKANSFGAFNQSFNTNTLFIDATNGRVGVGT